MARAVRKRATTMERWKRKVTKEIPRYAWFASPPFFLPPSFLELSSCLYILTALPSPFACRLPIALYLVMSSTSLPSLCSPTDITFPHLKGSSSDDGFADAPESTAPIPAHLLTSTRLSQSSASSHL